MTHNHQASRSLPNLRAFPAPRHTFDPHPPRNCTCPTPAFLDNHTHCRILAPRGPWVTTSSGHTAHTPHWALTPCALMTSWCLCNLLGSWSNNLTTWNMCAWDEVMRQACRKQAETQPSSQPRSIGRFNLASLPPLSFSSYTN